eukprot:TRINITY_DN15581_c0_g1_i1.p1 TRINITY_DN15581_c0_g1~~TRINITY_DN15581_c0_g1_i1.p1  ORF type:complete len:362 (-),score=43.21 TRINITY_DN15581_c0_g1_i1:3-1088(-)
MEWDLVNGDAAADWGQPAPAVAPQPAPADDNAEGEQARRNRPTEEQRRRSAMLSFLLRHAPNKYPDLKAKQHKGGFFPIDDILKRIQKTTLEQLRETVDASTSHRGSKRFEIATTNGSEYIRATYGHTFDVSQGLSLDGSGPALDGEESDQGRVSSLFDMVLSVICSRVEDYAEHFGDCPDGNLLTAIFAHLKKSINRSIGTKIIKSFLQPPLEHIDLSGLIVEQGTLTALAKCVNLKSLHMQGCFTCMTDTNLELITRRCKMLKVLDVSACRYITDAGLAAMAKHSNLTHLSIRFLHRITPRGVRDMLSVLVPKGLISVDASGCQSLTTDLDAWNALTKEFSDTAIVNSNILVSEAELQK